MNPSTVSRFTVTDVATRAPGNCFVCKTTKGPFIETGLRHDFYREAPDDSRDGDVYFCAACIVEMARTLNAESVDVQAQINEARRAGVVEGVLLGKKVLDEFSTGFIDRSLFTGLNVSGYRLVSNGDDAEDAGTESQGSATTSEGAVEDDQPSDGEGRNLLPSSSGAGIFE